jgi:hypothetical protein
VKKGYTLIIAAVTEVQNGTENLWKRGHSGGRHQYPNFGQYMQINWFKAFMIYLLLHIAGVMKIIGMLIGETSFGISFSPFLNSSMPVAAH